MREPDRIIRLKTVLARTGLSRSTIYRKIAEGTFPPQIRISVNGSGWYESDINRWIADPVAWRPKPSSMRFDNVGQRFRPSDFYSPARRNRRLHRQPFWSIPLAT
jgi:prophage regulatory protein